jgi:hypothetical protein
MPDPVNRVIAKGGARCDKLRDTGPPPVRHRFAIVTGYVLEYGENHLNVQVYPCREAQRLVLLLCVVLFSGDGTSEAVEPAEGRVLAGVVPVEALPSSAMDDQARQRLVNAVEEEALDGAYAVFLHASCWGRLPPNTALDCTHRVLEVDPTGIGTTQTLSMLTERWNRLRVLGTMEARCPTDGKSTAWFFLVRADRHSGARDDYHEMRAYVVDCGQGTLDVRAFFRDHEWLSELSWSDASEKPGYLGFMSDDGGPWALAVLSNGDRILVLDRQGSIVLDSESWGYCHLVREGGRVVLYAILSERPPASAIDEMPGGDRLHRERELGAWRRWSLRRISRGADEVFAEALVPAFRSPHDDNPEISRRSAPVVEKARVLFERLRTEGRIVDDLS